MRRIHLVLPVLAVFGASHAQTFPPHPTNGWVYDGAGLLDPSDEATISRLSRDFQRDTGAPIVVATLPSLASVGAQNEGIERYGAQLFDAWRIGHAQDGRNGGILLVVAKADHKVRIELGKDWRQDYDTGAKAIDQNTILPAFKAGDYSGGIVRGCQALVGLASGPAPEVGAPTAPASGVIDGPAPIVDTGDEWIGGGMILGFVLCCLALPIALAVVIVRALRRSTTPPPFQGSFRGTSNGPFPPRYTPTSGGPVYGGPTGEDDVFAAGMIAGSAISQPVYEPAPFVDSSPDYDAGATFDSSPSVDTSSTFDSGSSIDSDSSFDSSSSFDSGSSGGGGDTGSW